MDPPAAAALTSPPAGSSSGSGSDWRLALGLALGIGGAAVIAAVVAGLLIIGNQQRRKSQSPGDLDAVSAMTKDKRDYESHPPDPFGADSEQAPNHVATLAEANAAAAPVAAPAILAPGSMEAVGSRSGSELQSILRSIASQKTKTAREVAAVAAGNVAAAAAVAASASEDSSSHHETASGGTVASSKLVKAGSPGGMEGTPTTGATATTSGKASLMLHDSAAAMKKDVEALALTVDRKVSCTSAMYLPRSSTTLLK